MENNIENKTAINVNDALIKEDCTAFFGEYSEMINPYAYKYFQDILNFLNIKIYNRR